MRSKNAEYQETFRNKMKAEGKKRLPHIWIYKVDEPRVREYIHMVTEETKNNKNNI